MRRVPPVLLALLVLAAPASAAPDRSLWATVNICDTPLHPDAMGVRASMPGDGYRERMYVRFIAQAWSPRRHRWRRVHGRGRSPWLYAGSARFRSGQVGWTFEFDPPASQVYLVRALAIFEWRERKARRKGRRARWSVVMRRRRVTRGGIRGVAGGDLPWTSLASCYIK
jgi:hypothetical protein